MATNYQQFTSTSECEFWVNGVRFPTITEVTLSTTRERNNVMGSGTRGEPIGYVDGDVTRSANMTIYREGLRSFENLAATLGVNDVTDGLLEFTMVIVEKKNSIPHGKKQLTFKINGSELSYSGGAQAVQATLDIFPTGPIRTLPL